MGDNSLVMSVPCGLCSVVLLLLCQVQVCESEVITSVTRSVTDSFRVGQRGCKGNERICSNVDATCNQDDGLCSCSRSKYPHFRNPVVTTKGGETVYGDSYGCVKEEFMRIDLMSANCRFKPFQLLPSEPQEMWTGFGQSAGDSQKVIQCFSLQSVSTKSPTNNSLSQVIWFDKTYIDYNVPEEGIFHFKWKKSVRVLQGLMIKMYFNCKLDNGGFTITCLEGKILGTWKVAQAPLPTTSSKSTSKLAACNSSYGKDVAIPVLIALSLVVLLLLGIVGFLHWRKNRTQVHDCKPTESNIELDKNTDYEYPEPQYADLANRGCEDEKHVYQGLVGVHDNKHESIPENYQREQCSQPNQDNVDGNASNYE